jgi:hypothetical protein
MSLNIPPVGPSLPKPGALANPASASPPPQDRFESLPPSEDADRLRRAARGLIHQDKLGKAETTYLANSWACAADGTLFIGYAEAGEGQKGYLAAVDPQGRIAWELALGENDVAHVGLMPDGRIKVGTPDGHLVCSTDGRLLESRTGGPAVRSHHQDSSGMHLEVLSEQGTLRALGADGREVALPPVLTGTRARSVLPTPEGGLMVLAAGAAVRLAPGGATVAITPIPQWPAEGQTTYTPERAWGLVGGDVLVQRNCTTATGFPGRTKPVFGGLVDVGSNWDPAKDMPASVTRADFVRLAPDGTERWRTEQIQKEILALPSSLIVNPDGSILLTGRKLNVNRVDPEGRSEVLFDLPYFPDIFRAGAQPGTILVRHRERVSRLGPEGQILADLSLDAEKRGFQLVGDLQDGRILFSEGRTALWATDPVTGTWTRLTDLEVDHSARPEDLLAPDLGPAPGEVESGDGWVDIGNVRLPRR